MQIQLQFDSFKEMIDYCKSQVLGEPAPVIGGPKDPTPPKRETTKAETASPKTETKAEPAPEKPKETTDTVTTADQVKAEMSRVKSGSNPGIVAVVRGWINEFGHTKLDECNDAERATLYNKLKVLS